MSGILKKEYDDVGDDATQIWTFTRGKHANQTLAEVAEEDPGYLRWVYDEVNDLTKEQREEIESLLEEYDA